MDVDIDLMPPFSTYFDAQNAHDVDGMLACFSEDAEVLDEGQDMLGCVAIRAWMSDTIRKYRPTIRPIRVAKRAEQTIVTAQISGTFPGSPIDLRYRFTTSGNKIARLEIG